MMDDLVTTTSGAAEDAATDVQRRGGDGDM